MLATMLTLASQLVVLVICALLSATLTESHALGTPPWPAVQLFKDECMDVNIVAVTDVHSWLSGHRHPDNVPRLDADYGDLRSFYHHVKAAADQQGCDVFFFNSGDLLEGTGLSDSTPVHGEAVTPLVQQMPVDHKL